MICYGRSRGNVLMEDVVTVRLGSRRRSLPKAWPRNVKLAVLHVVAPAHKAIVAARSAAQKSPDARTRRAGDVRGAPDEIAMLEEELRIKDGRMAMIDARGRPYYGPIERMPILQLRAARGWSQAETARRFLVKPTTIASWLKRTDDAAQLRLCRRENALTSSRIWTVMSFAGSRCFSHPWGENGSRRP